MNMYQLERGYKMNNEIRARVPIFIKRYGLYQQEGYGDWRTAPALVGAHHVAFCYRLKGDWIAYVGDDNGKDHFIGIYPRLVDAAEAMRDYEAFIRAEGEVA